MAGKKKTTKSAIEVSDDFAQELIKSINKSHNEKLAFNLGDDDAPTGVERWISTGSKQLDFIIANQLGGGFPEGRIVEIQGPTSCHAIGDRISLHDGRTIAVEHVKVGDELLGPDGLGRKVLECHSGEDEMYEIQPSRGGKTYTVNQHHLLHLQRAHGYSKNMNSPRSKANEVLNIPVKEYLTKSNTFKKMYRQKRVSIEQFYGRKTSNLPISPYVLGLLLGNASLEERRIELTMSDVAIEREFCEYIKTYGFVPKCNHKKDDMVTSTGISPGIRSAQFLHEGKREQAQIRNSLRALGILRTTSETKFIPSSYKFSSIAERREVIAGLIDTDGYLNKSCFVFVTKSQLLSEDMAFICASVGLRVSTSDKMVVLNGKRQTYKKLTISGRINTIPTKLTKKKAVEGSQKIENQYLTGFSVKPVGKGKFYGFSVNKDQLYLTDDFSVFHNSGKSHIAFEVAKSTQRMGGIVVYIDTENATSLQNLMNLGIDVKKRFVFVQTACTEDIFAVAEETILKARSINKDVPVTIIWDSIAASSPKAELEGDYDTNTIGLQARTLGRGFRKITNIIGGQKVLFLLINQQRVKIGVLFGDPLTTPGGNAIPYAASVRIRISSTGQQQIKNKDGDVIGIKVKAKTIKNKIARPFRTCEFQIHFGVGVIEHEEVFDLFRAYCSALPDNVLGVKCGKDFVSVSGAGAWKQYTVFSEDGEVTFEKKFHKSAFGTEVLYKPEFAKHMDALFASSLSMAADELQHSTYDNINMSSVEEVQAGNK